MVYHADNEIAFCYIKSWNTCAYSVYFKSKKELNYDRFVDQNLLFSDLQIYRISFFLLDIRICYPVVYCAMNLRR